MLKQQQTKERGFTIIEVMIVLAIAGAIIGIVLLAVPALNRSNRNNAIKADANAVSQAVSEFSNNNEGRLPNNTAKVDGPNIDLTRTGLAGATPSRAKVQGSTQVRFTGVPAAADTGVVVVRFGQKCTTPTSFRVAAERRATAILYNIETTGNPAPRCVEV